MISQRFVCKGKWSNWLRVFLGSASIGEGRQTHAAGRAPLVPIDHARLKSLEPLAARRNAVYFLLKTTVSGVENRCQNPFGGISEISGGSCREGHLFDANQRGLVKKFGHAAAGALPKPPRAYTLHAVRPLRIAAPSSRGPGHRIFSPRTGVRIPLGSVFLPRSYDRHGKHGESSRSLLNKGSSHLPGRDSAFFFRTDRVQIL